MRERGDMSEPEHVAEVVTDVVIVGSGGGLCGAVTAAAQGLETIVIEKLPLVGGSTGMSGGVLWLPNNPLMQAEGVEDSFEEAMEYFDSVVGDAGPASSPQRRAAYVTEGINMVRFLEGQGMRFRRCEGYSDYYSGMRDVRGGSLRGRSIEATAIDAHTLGDWGSRIIPGMGSAVPWTIYTGEVAPAQLMNRSLKSMAIALRVGMRTYLGKLRRQDLLTNGGALIGQTLRAALAERVAIWTETALVDLLVEEGRVAGVVAKRDGQDVTIRARRAVLLSAGGFARNAEMRARYGRQPSSTSWTIANPGDTGEVIEAAFAHGATGDLMDDAWWIPSGVQADGRPSSFNGERCKPGSIIVDRDGQRFFNEAVSYMEAGQHLYEHNQEGRSIPSWLVIDSRNRRRYMWSFQRAGKTPEEWISSGYMKRAGTLRDLAAECGIDADGLEATVQRFNGFAATGDDLDFHRGEGGHERFQGDPTHKPNPSLGPIDKAPFYAVAIYPGDVGTSGGLLTDEFARVLDADHQPIEGLYAAGNTTASVMGRSYLGAGSSIGASFVFSYIAMKHAASVDPARR
jgi:3-oxosteroid 1-dehydrogenase